MTGLTIAERTLSRKAGRRVRRGDFVTVSVAALMIHDGDALDGHRFAEAAGAPVKHAAGRDTSIRRARGAGFFT